MANQGVYMLPPGGPSTAQQGPNQGQPNQFYGQSDPYQTVHTQGQPNQGQSNQNLPTHNQFNPGQPAGYYAGQQNPVAYSQQGQPNAGHFPNPGQQGQFNQGQYPSQQNQNSFGPIQPNPAPYVQTQLNNGYYPPGPNQGQVQYVQTHPNQGYYPPSINQSQPNQTPYVQPNQGYYAPNQGQPIQAPFIQIQQNQGYLPVHSNQGPHVQMQPQNQFVQGIPAQQPVPQAQPIQKVKAVSKKQEKHAAALAELMKILNWIITTTVDHNNEIIMRKMFSKDRALKELIEIDNQWTSFIQTSSLLPTDVTKDALLKAKKIDCMRAMKSYLRLLRKYGSKDRGSRIAKMRIQLGKKFQLKSDIVGKAKQKIKDQTDIDITNQTTTKRRNVIMDNGEDSDEEDDEDDENEDDNGAPSYMQ